MGVVGYGEEQRRGISPLARDRSGMLLERLRLTNFRNYETLDLRLRPGLSIFQGRNAQGKSNLLEGIALLATSRSFRAGGERETVRWDAPGRWAWRL